MHFEIKLSGLRFFAHHGVFEQEKILGNEFVVDLTVTYEKIDSYLSYAELYEDVKAEMYVPRDLLEEVAEAILLRLKKYSAITSASVTITKPHPPISGFIGAASVTLRS